MYKYIIGVLIIFFSITIYAVNETDSLINELSNRNEAKEQSLLLNRISKSYSNTNTDSAILYAKKGLELSINLEYKLGIAENAASLGDYYIIYDSLATAHEYYLLAIDKFKSLEMEFEYSQILMILGNINLSQSKYSKALSYYQESLTISEQNNYSEILPHLYNNLGILYHQLKEYEKAIDYINRSYDGYTGEELKAHKAHAFNNLANIYMDQSNDSLAISYFNQSHLLFLEINYFVEAASVLIDLGKFYSDRANYEKSLDYYSQAYDIISNKGIEYKGPKSRSLVMIMGNMGLVYYELGNYPKAENYFKETIKMAQQNHYFDWIEKSSYYLFKIMETSRKYAEALDYHKIFEQYGDSILNENTIKRITELEMQFQFDKKMKQIELDNAKEQAKQQRREFIYIILIGLFIFISVISILLFYNQRSKVARVELKQQNLKLEHEKLQQELEHKNRELATNVMYLLKKNEFITSTAEKLKSAQLNFKRENQKVIQDVVRDLLMNSSKDVWKEFEVRFQEVHSDFYKNLNKKYPDLTPNEKKICAFLRLNMSTKDISAITYQSVRSINMARFRLRKKLELESDENLINILSKL